MPMHFETSTVRFEGECMVEDALVLLEFLNANPGVSLKLAACTYLHTAILQVIAAAKPTALELPLDPWIARLIQTVCIGLPAPA